MTDLRCYLVISTGSLPTPSEAAWASLFQQAKTKPMSAAIILAARAAQNHIQHNKRSQGTGNLRKYSLIGFELDDRDRDDLLAVLDQQAARRNITGTQRQKFEAVIQAELRESAVDLGYTVNQSNQIGVVIVGLGDRAEAISEARAYLITNANIWY